MVPSSPPPPASTFIVRFWWDRSGDESRWRGHIQHVQSGECASCLDLEGILDVIQYLRVMTDPLGERGEAIWFSLTTW
jgi:hypothetical protein